MFEKLTSQLYKVSGKTYEREKITDRDLVRMYYTDCTFVECDLTECDFTYCFDHNFRLADCRFLRCTFSEKGYSTVRRDSEDCAFTDCVEK